MRKAATVLIAAAALTSTAAWAQPGRLSDVDFLQASRCAGLASSGKLGTSDPAMSNLVKSQAMNRPLFIMDRSDEMQRDAKRAASRAGDIEKSRLSAELTGVCAQLKG